MPVDPKLRSLNIDVPAQPESLVKLSLLLADDEVNLNAVSALIGSDMALASAKDSGVKSLADMKGKPVGVLSTSTGETWAKENMEKYGFSEIKGYNAQQDLLLDLQAGRVAGAISDIAGLQFSFIQMTSLQVVERIKTTDKYGIMMQKDSPNLKRVNDAISAIKKDGTLAALHKKWLGADADPSTSTVMVLDLPMAQ